MGLSRIEDLLQDEIDNKEYNGPLLSRIEEILSSLFGFTPTYDGDILSRVEYMLVTKEEITPLSRIEQIILCKIRGVEYTGAILSRIEGLANQIYMGEWTTSPILDNNGRPILDYLGGKILGRERRHE